MHKHLFRMQIANEFYVKAQGAESAPAKIMPSLPVRTCSTYDTDYTTPGPRRLALRGVYLQSTVVETVPACVSGMLNTTASKCVA